MRPKHYINERQLGKKQFFTMLEKLADDYTDRKNEIEVTGECLLFKDEKTYKFEIK